MQPVLAQPQPAPGAATASVKMPELPKGKETDVKFYPADGTAVTGRDAFERMPQAGLVLWSPATSFLPWTM